MRICARRLLLGGLASLIVSGGALAVTDASAEAFLGYGNRTSVFGEAGSGDGQFSLHPGSGAPGAGVAVDDTTHDVYVTDTENHRIEKFSAEGVFIAAWGWGVSDGEEKFEVCTSGCREGVSGAGEGQFGTPVSVAVDNSTGGSSGDVYVADRGDLRVEKFSAAGVPLGSFGAVGDLGSAVDPEGSLGDLRGGNSVFVDPITGNVWAADASHKRAVEYSPSGEYLAEIPGLSENAFGVTVDSGGDVYVVNGAKSVEEYGPAPSFAFIRSIDNSGTRHPRAVVTNSADEVFVGDGGEGIPYRILQYGPGAEETTSSKTFGESIGASSGLAIDSTDGKIYVADGTNDDIDVFGLVELPDVSTGVSSNVKGTSATLAGAINPGGIETHYYFEYGEGLRSAEETSSAAISQPVTTDLTGLLPNTAYRYRLVGVNESGTSTGQEGEFTTGPVVADVSTGPATNVKGTTATLSGQLDPEEGVETHYRFQYGTTTEYGSVSELETSSTEGLISATAAVVGLEPGTTYHYRILTFTELGEALGEDKTFTTPPAIPTVNGQEPYATDLAPHEATLHGTISPGRGITTYRFVYGLTTSYGSSTAEAYTQFNEGEIAIPHEEVVATEYAVEQLITGLQPGIVYHYALQAVNTSGVTTGPDETFTTPSEPIVEEPGVVGTESPAPVSITPPSTLQLLPIPVFPKERPIVVPRPKCKKGFVKKNGKCVRKPHRKAKRRKK